MQWDRVHTFGTVDVGDLYAIELAEARVRVVSLWGVGSLEGVMDLRLRGGGL